MLFVLGASGGLGSGLMDYLASTGEAASFYKNHRGLTRSELDLSDYNSVELFWKKVDSELTPNEPIHIINAAGRSINGFCHKLGTDDWKKTIDDNLTSNFYLVKALSPIVKNRPGSSILLFSSVVAELGVPGTVAYAASKSGLRGLVRTASKELARSRATINCVELGYFDRGMIEQVPEEHLQKLLSDVPVGRLGTVKDLFQCCHFALSCSYLTGTFIKLNGGLI